MNTNNSKLFELLHQMIDEQIVTCKKKITYYGRIKWIIDIPLIVITGGTSALSLTSVINVSDASMLQLATAITATSNVILVGLQKYINASTKYLEYVQKLRQFESLLLQLHDEQANISMLKEKYDQLSANISDGVNSPRITLDEK